MRYYSVAEAGKMLGVSRVTVFRWIKRGKIQATAEQKGLDKIVYKISENALLNTSANLTQEETKATCETSVTIRLLLSLKKDLQTISKTQQLIVDQLQEIKLSQNNCKYELQQKNSKAPSQILKEALKI